MQIILTQQEFDDIKRVAKEDGRREQNTDTLFRVNEMLDGILHHFVDMGLLYFPKYPKDIHESRFTDLLHELIDRLYPKPKSNLDF